MDFVNFAIYLSLILILIAPIRLAYAASLSLAFFDASGPQFASATSLGVTNALKVLLVPTLLLIRLKGAPVYYLWRTRRRLGLMWMFVLLSIFASLAVLWSPEFLKLSAMKGAAYLWGYLMWFAVVLYGFATRKIDLKLLFGVWILGVLLGIAQTYFLGGIFSRGLYEESLRFTAFNSPQSYAAFYTYLLAIFLFATNRLTLRSLLALLSTLGLILMAGSRYSFATAIWVVTIWALYYIRSGFFLSRILKRLFTLIFAFIFFLLIGLANLPTLIHFLGGTRIAELFEKDLSTVATFAWRMGMWREAWVQINDFSLGEMFWGRGTSASALVALQYDSRYSPDTIDANRVMHNELLKALYEWGIIGIGLLSTLILGLFLLAFIWIVRGRREGFFLLAVLGPLTAGLFVENILANSGSPVGIGICLSLAYVHYVASGRIYAHPKATHPLPTTGR